ncbi:MAG: hypothetical protein GOV02_01220 [Candidatus Aenigmarchaeota archaeon]|nr:hypothetical protein [Candidatus Aenigmarchaeota archaeon]
MDIRVKIEVPLEANARPTYVQDTLLDIDGVQSVNPDYHNSTVNVTADVSSQAEAKTVMKNVNRVVGTKYVDSWNLL